MLNYCSNFNIVHNNMRGTELILISAIVCCYLGTDCMTEADLLMCGH